MKRVTIFRNPRKEDFSSIIDMQIENHKSYLSESDQRNGYVTVLTPHWFLSKVFSLLARYPTGEPAGYLVVVDCDTVLEHPFLRSFNEKLSSLKFENYAIIAQIGVNRSEVGKRSGIGTQLYDYFFTHVVPFEKYTSVITEVSDGNPSSYRFHEKFGFENVHDYEDSFGNGFTIMRKIVNHN